VRGVAAVLLALLAAGCAGRPARLPAPSATAAGPLALRAVLALNPALDANGYRLQPAGAGLSVYQRPGSSQIALLVNGAGTVVAVRGIFPTNTGVQPWFDQAAAVVSPAAAGASTSLGSPSSTAGAGTSSAGSSASAGGGLTAAPLNTAPMVGSTSAPPPGAYTQTLWLPAAAAAPAPSALPSFGALEGRNPALARARAQGAFVPGSGTPWGQQGYGLDVLLARDGTAAGFVGLFPLTEGWSPIFDQLQGHQDLQPDRYYKAFTQHLWLVAPQTLR